MKITMDLTHTLILLAAVVYSASAYSKYGRTCKDIGCRPSETCVIAQDSCSWSQQEGKECGSYPTCKKSTTTNSSPGASLNPSVDNARNNPYGHSNGNNYSPGSPYNPGNTYNPPSNTYSGGHQVDPNQIFGNPNRQPQANQPWNNLPIFPPNPTSGQVSPQQALYPQPQNPYSYPMNPVNVPGGLNPHTDIFGHPPPGMLPQYPYPTRGAPRTPSLLDQFLNGPSGRRRNSSSTIHTTWQKASFIVILSISNILIGFILTARH